MTTKKALKAASVEANKRTAYIKKARTMLGHIAHRAHNLNIELAAAYDAGQTAEQIATAIACREPVGAAVHAQKLDSMADARKWAMNVANNIKAQLEANGYDVDALAPRPNALRSSREQYKRAQTLRSRYTRFLTVTRHGHFTDSKETYAWNEATVERFANETEEMAAVQYDMFICKLVAKVGECDSATLTGNHVWGNSVLTVTKGDVTECWKTRQIENCSVLGNYFPQWPTRLMKGAK